jgi:hypothetical protein
MGASLAAAATRGLLPRQARKPLLSTHERQGHEVHRIEGPNGEVIGQEEIMGWAKADPTP